MIFIRDNEDEKRKEYGQDYGKDVLYGIGGPFGRSKPIVFLSSRFYLSFCHSGIILLGRSGFKIMYNIRSSVVLSLCAG